MDVRFSSFGGLCLPLCGQKPAAKKLRQSCEKVARGGQRQLNGGQKGPRDVPKRGRPPSYIRKALWMVKKAIPELSGQPFEPHFESILEAKFGDFSCYFLASFFDRFLKASGGILGAILGDFGNSVSLLFRLCKQMRTPRIHRPWR